MRCPIHNESILNPVLVDSIRSWGCSKCDWRYEESFDKSQNPEYQIRMSMSVPLKPCEDKEGALKFKP